MATEDAPPVSEAERILAGLAADLVPAVYSFMHGGMPGRLPPAASAADASVRLRHLHDALDAARRDRRGAYTIAVLAVALRLQAVIYYEVLKLEHGINTGAG